MSRTLRFDGQNALEFLNIDADAEIPDNGGAVQISLAQWREHRDFLIGRNGPVGITIENTEIVAELDGRIFESSAMIRLQFPAFADGRAYTQARAIREEIGFEGDIRASGEAAVIDQFVELWRTGFSSVELRGDQSNNDAIAAISQFSAYYQPSQITAPTIRELRRNMRAS